MLINKTSKVSTKQPPSRFNETSWLQGRFFLKHAAVLVKCVGIFAVRHKQRHPNNCTDKDAAMKKISHVDCKTIKKANMCFMLKSLGTAKLCTCSCPALTKKADGKHKRRLQVGYHGMNKCKMMDFDRSEQHCTTILASETTSAEFDSVCVNPIITRCKPRWRASILFHSLGGGESRVLQS